MLLVELMLYNYAFINNRGKSLIKIIVTEQNFEKNTFIHVLFNSIFIRYIYVHVDVKDIILL